MAEGPSRDELMDYLRSTFALTPLHKLLGIRMVESDEPGKVVVEMPVAPEAFNGSGNLHGGAIATLVDVTCMSGTSGVRKATWCGPKPR
jgi:acyl-coenzyme A thioesterase PaaI-like protein